MPRDYYEVLGVATHRLGGRHQESLPQTGPRTPSRSQSRRQAGRGPLQGDPGRLRRPERQDQARTVRPLRLRRSRHGQNPFAGGGGGGRRPEGGFEFDPNDLASILRQFGGGGGLGGMEREDIDPSELFGQQQPGSRPAGRSARRPRPRSPFPSPWPPWAARSISRWTAGRSRSRSRPASRTARNCAWAARDPDGADLLLKLKIEPHPYFRREGNNVVVEVPISVAEAVLGTRVDVPTLDGTQVTVKVPPGTSSGSRLRLRGKGIKGGDRTGRDQGRGAGRDRRPQPGVDRGVRPPQSAESAGDVPWVSPTVVQAALLMNGPAGEPPAPRGVTS